MNITVFSSSGYRRRVLRISTCLLALVPVALSAQRLARPIARHGLLVEEAYVQDARAVQHGLVFGQSQATRAWTLSVFERVPIGNRGQVDLRVPLRRDPFSGGAPDVGDAEIGYAHQLTGGVEARVATAAHFMLTIPSGDFRSGRGTGAVGYRLVLPLSVRPAPRLALHTNVSGLVTPSARNAAAERATTREYALSQSIAWHAVSWLDLVADFDWRRADEVIGAGEVASQSSRTIAPGLRGSVPVGSRFRMVPGIELQSTETDFTTLRRVLFYLAIDQRRGVR